LTADEKTRRREAIAVHTELSTPPPATGSWDQVLLVDANIDIDGDPGRMPRRANELLARMHW
jgi:hypothetical protein